MTLKMQIMKPRLLLLVVLAALFLNSSFQDSDKLNSDLLTGAWQLKNGTEEQTLLFVDGYFTQTIYDKTERKFVHTRGGSYTVDKNKLTVEYEFDTKDKEQVGQKTTYNIAAKDKQLIANINNKEEQWAKTDDANSGLAGLWKITARKQGKELQTIHQTGTRKTVKILTSTRFQWAAIDPGTKSFMGTGGGTYTFKDGKYTEHIEFFSRDSSRVGSSLSFEGKLENGDWHHSGLSSRGEPIYEVWSRNK